MASAQASGRSPISRWPQSAITRSRARSRRAYSNASATGSWLSRAPHSTSAGQRTRSRSALGSSRRRARAALTVEDFDRAVAFYRDALGLGQLADWSSADGRVIVLEAGQATLELFDEAQARYVDEIEAGARVSGAVRLAFEVGDSEAAASRLVEAGGEPVSEPVTTPWQDRNARVKAPDGLQLTLFTAAAPT